MVRSRVYGRKLVIEPSRIGITDWHHGLASRIGITDWHHGLASGIVFSETMRNLPMVNSAYYTNSLKKYYSGRSNRDVKNNKDVVLAPIGTRSSKIKTKAPFLIVDF